jgi:hypothetical protein
MKNDLGIETYNLISSYKDIGIVVYSLVYSGGPLSPGARLCDDFLLSFGQGRYDIFGTAGIELLVPFAQCILSLTKIILQKRILGLQVF